MVDPRVPDEEPEPIYTALAQALFDQQFHEASLSGKCRIAAELDAAADPEVALAHVTNRWKHFPPGFTEFVESPQYLGLRGEVWKPILDIGNEAIDGGYHEIVLTGSIGYGKSILSDLIATFTLCELLCLRSIPKTFGLITGTDVVMILQSLTERLATKVLFRPLRHLVRKSPFFRGIGWDRRRTSELIFPQGVRVVPVAGVEQAAIGENVIAATLDEVNFFSVVVGSVKARGSDEYDAAQQNYQAISKRMKSRFMRRGKVPCRLLIVSSSRYPEDFTELKAEEAKTNASILIVRRAQWDTKPSDRYMPERFRMAVGGTFTRSRVLAPDEPDPDDQQVIAVPEDYRLDFERDPDGSLRDIAGIPTMTLAPFFPRRESVREAVTAQFAHPFSHEETTLQDGLGILQDRLHLQVPAPRAVHLDLSVKHDCTGLALVYVSGVKRVGRTAMQVAEAESAGRTVQVEELAGGRRRYYEDLPCYVVEAMLRIKAPPGDEIQLTAVVDLVLRLKRLGVPIQFASADSFQSTAPLQMLLAAGIATGVVSVDKTTGAYFDLKSAVNDGRITYYDYPPFLSEVLALEYHARTGKVDHPNWCRDVLGRRVRGSKDVSDAVAGAVNVLGRHAEAWWKPTYATTVDEQVIGVGEDGIAIVQDFPALSS